MPGPRCRIVGTWRVTARRTRGRCPIGPRSTPPPPRLFECARLPGQVAELLVDGERHRSMHRFLGPPAHDEGPIEHVVGLREGEALLGLAWPAEWPAAPPPAPPRGAPVLGARLTRRPSGAPPTRAASAERAVRDGGPLPAPPERGHEGTPLFLRPPLAQGQRGRWPADRHGPAGPRGGRPRARRRTCRAAHARHRAASTARPARGPGTSGIWLSGFEGVLVVGGGLDVGVGDAGPFSGDARVAPRQLVVLRRAVVAGQQLGHLVDSAAGQPLGGRAGPAVQFAPPPVREALIGQISHQRLAEAPTSRPRGSRKRPSSSSSAPSDLDALSGQEEAQGLVAEAAAEYGGATQDPSRPGREGVDLGADDRVEGVRQRSGVTRLRHQPQRSPGDRAGSRRPGRRWRVTSCGRSGDRPGGRPHQLLGVAALEWSPR